VLCPNGSLEAIARANPASLEDLARLPELRRWQVREIGAPLVEALRAPADGPNEPVAPDAPQGASS
jgi:hypothetical protein